MSKILVLRTIAPDLRAFNNFKYPETGIVTAPDWRPTYECGHGLHGLPRGIGNGLYLLWGKIFRWQLIEVDTSPDNYMFGDGELTDKCKFKTGNVLLTGTREEVTSRLLEAYPNTPIVGASVTVGDSATASTGDFGVSISGFDGKSFSGYQGTSSSGDGGISMAGDFGIAKSGDYGKAIAGYEGVATVASNGIAMVGVRGKASGGQSSTLVFDYFFQGINNTTTVKVGENGIWPNETYACNSLGSVTRVRSLLSQPINE